MAPLISMRQTKRQWLIYSGGLWVKPQEGSAGYGMYLSTISLKSPTRSTLKHSGMDGYQNRRLTVHLPHFLPAGQYSIRMTLLKMITALHLQERQASVQVVKRPIIYIKIIAIQMWI